MPVASVMRAVRHGFGPSDYMKRASKLVPEKARARLRAEVCFPAYRPSRIQAVTCSSVVPG